MEVKIKRLSATAKIPTRGSLSAAGYDLYADTDLNVAEYKYKPSKENSLLTDGKIYIDKHETVLIHTGIAMEIPEGYFGAVFARSSIALKRGLRPANCTAVIDSDYRGEILVALHNDSDSVKEISIDPEERIAQIVIMPYLNVDFTETEELSDTVRGEGGFGSTGKL